MRRLARVDFLLWPFTLLCLNGCYGPPQVLRGQVERLPEAPAVVAVALDDDAQVRLAAELADPAAWAERVVAGGRVDLTPSRQIELNRRGVPAAHLDALHAREMRAREADCAARVAAAERRLTQRHDADQARCLDAARLPPPYWGVPAWPGYYLPPPWWR